MELENKIIKLSEDKTIKVEKVKKIIKLIKLIVVDKQTDIDIISSKLDLPMSLIFKYINEDEILHTILTDKEYIELKNQLKIINKNIQDSYNSRKIVLVSKIIDEIFSTRYKVTDIARHNFISNQELTTLLNDEKFIKEYFGSETVTKLKERIDETANLRMQNPKDLKKNKVLVEDRINLMVLKNEIHFLDEYSFRKLNYASNYLLSGANLDLVIKQFEVPLNSLLFSLNDPSMKDIIKDDYYERLKVLGKIENDLYNGSLQNKKNLMEICVSSLIQNNFDLSRACHKSQIPYELYKRICKQDLLYIMFDSSVADKVSALFETKEKDKKRSI